MLYDRRPDLDAPARAMLDAADYLDKHGWGQGSERNLPCMVQALHEVADKHTAFAASERFRATHGMMTHRWNDDVCRSGAEAAAKFRDLAWGL